jgi:hypothetical protein
MPGGLLTLVSYGYESQVLSSRPEVTFFKIMYRRHTNFGIEPVEQFFKNTADFGTTVTVNLSKYGDLIGETYIIIDLPSIPQNTRKDIPSTVKKFKWVDNLGYVLIKEVKLEIGGILVDKHFGEWLYIWNELTKGSAKKRALDKMVGNVPELNEYSNGKDTYRLQVPLSFWFCNDISNTLPIIAMNHNEVKIHVEFNEFNNVHNVTPTHYITIEEEFVLFNQFEIISQSIDKEPAVGEFVYYDVNTKKMYINYISGTFQSWTNLINKSLYKITGSDSRFVVIPASSPASNIIVADLNYFNGITPTITEAFALCKYVFLDNFERIKFMKSDIEFLVDLVLNTQDLAVNTFYNKIKINFTQPTAEIIWRLILEKNRNRNKHFLYSSNDGKNIMRKTSINIDGNKTVEPLSSDFFSYVQNYMFHTNSVPEGINSYSFSLFPEDTMPSGSVNFSELQNVTLNMTLDRTINYQNRAFIKVYGKIYNIMRIVNGRASLAFVR